MLGNPAAGFVAQRMLLKLPLAHTGSLISSNQHLILIRFMIAIADKVMLVAALYMGHEWV